MLIDIEKIVVGDRIRKDFGDIDELAQDIKDNGLINPPTVNKDYVLLAGERRLRACKSLGWRQIPVHMLDTKDEAHDLAVEMSENNLRRNFTGSELAEGIRRQMAIESEKAKERQQATQFGSDGGANIGTTAGKSRDKAAEQFGISGEQARKTLYVDDHRDLLDPADFAEWDEGKLSTNKAFQRIKAAMAQVERERDMAKEDLTEAWQAQENAEVEVVMLKRKLESIEHPEPEVIEREVPPADYEDMKRQVAGTKRESERLNRKYQDVLKENMELQRQLEQANDTIVERGRNSSANRDVEQLINNIYTLLNRHGGKAQAFGDFHLVDSETQNECRKALVALDGFAQNLLIMTEETT